MKHFNQLSEADKFLMIKVLEPRARKKIAKEAGLPTGALPVLSAIVSRTNLGLSSRPLTVYGAEIANEMLIRAYIFRLIAGGFVELQRRRGCRFLVPTATSLCLADAYAREMRGGSQAFELSY